MTRSMRLMVLAMMPAVLWFPTWSVAGDLDALMQQFRVSPAGLKPAPAFTLRGLDGKAGAVNIQESPSPVAAWAREKKLAIPIVLDADGDVTRQYGVIATPTVFLIDRQGRLVGRVVGPRDWSSPAGRALLTDLLATSASR